MNVRKVSAWILGVIALFTGLIAEAESSAGQEVASLAAGFSNPPASAKPHTWWHWMNGNISKAGITADLEAMKAAGVGGAQIFDISYGIPDGPVAFNSPEWRECVIHAAKECERLGLELTLNTASGWSCAGAPWNSVTNGQKFVCTREISVKGPQHFNAILELPRPEGWMAKEMRPDRRRGKFYEDLAVFAYPTPAAGSANGISNLWMKMFRVYDQRDQNRLDAERTTPGGLVDLNRMVELTAKMDGDGRLVWDVPVGDWTILRVGYCASGRMNYPPSAFGDGTECDKLDAKALDLHWAGLMDQIIPKCGPGLKAIVIDSYESSVMNWTQNFESEFRRRRGYSLRPYYPVLVGRIVGSNEVTERFLEDYRRTISELFIENFGQHSRAKANAYGLKLYLEPYCGLPASPYEYARAADIPMTEFWTFKSQSAPDWRITPDSGISEAHVWGKSIVGAESFTTWPKDGRWKLDPWYIKPQTDYQFCNGVNRIIYHTFAHQPWTDDRLVPGMTMGRFGIMFNRGNTWWKQGRVWSEYLSRCQFMLQQGRAVADVFSYYGEEPREHRPFSNGEVDKRSEHDTLTTEALYACRAENGWLIAPSGERVRFLTIPVTVNSISAKVLKRLDEIAEAGVEIIGNPPKRPFGLAGYADGDKEFKRLVAKLWARTNVSDRTYANAHIGFVHPAFTRDFFPMPGAGGLMHTHRVVGESTDVYFLARAKNDAARIECNFRTVGKKPELWNAETNEKYLPREWKVKGNYTSVTVPFSPFGSMFVVFPSVPTPGLRVEPQWKVVSEQKLEGPWQVKFQPKRGAPEGPVVFEKLVSWTERPEDGIRYFSGAAVYSKSLSWKKSSSAKKVVLDLGEMQNIATVRLNGKEVGIVWKPPYEIDVTKFLREGKNQLEIEVVNKWPNRLIGDEFKPNDVEWVDDKRWSGTHLASWPKWLANPEKRPSGRVTFTTWHHWNKDDPLLPSGLMGPVKLVNLTEE